MTDINGDVLLTPSEVARRFSVNPKTVTRWARAGLIPVTKTLGGHRRYSKSAVDKLITQKFENGDVVE